MLNWTLPRQPTNYNSNVALSMLLGLGVVGVANAIYFALLRSGFSHTAPLLIITAVSAVAGACLLQFMQTWAQKQYRRINLYQEPGLRL